MREPVLDTAGGGLRHRSSERDLVVLDLVRQPVRMIVGTALENLLEAEVDGQSLTGFPAAQVLLIDADFEAARQPPGSAVLRQGCHRSSSASVLRHAVVSPSF